MEDRRRNKGTLLCCGCQAQYSLNDQSQVVVIAATASSPTSTASAPSAQAPTPRATVQTPPTPAQSSSTSPSPTTQASSSTTKNQSVQRKIDTDDADDDDDSKQSSKLDSSRISALMSEKLLRGWTMLAESCPTCMIPLLRAPGERVMMKCLQCHIDYLMPKDFDPTKHRVDQVQ